MISKNTLFDDIINKTISFLYYIYHYLLLYFYLYFYIFLINFLKVLGKKEKGWWKREKKV